MQISNRARQVEPFLAMDVLAEAQQLERQGADVVHLEVGEPDFDTPACIKAAALEALQAGRTHYTQALGLPELREAIAEHYRERYGVRVSPAQILVTAGTSPALMLLFSAVLEPGDEVIITDPYYACYPSFIRFAGGRPVMVRVDPAEGYQLEPARVRAALSPRTKAILINSPANPTGAVLSAETLKALAELGPLVVSDEIYHGLTYVGEERTILEFSDRAVVLNGFSKRYAMTGWRLGFVILPADLVRPMEVMAQNFFISASDFVQHAGIAALRKAGPDAERMRQVYDRRRRYLVSALRELGFGVPVEPAGAFYVLADARRWGENSLELARRILRGAHVAVTPGVDFGPAAEGHLRFSYTAPEERIAEAVARLGRLLHG
ncbi:MAG: aspartate aminotransferase [Chloroflexota bacterium]